MVCFVDVRMEQKAIFYTIFLKHIFDELTNVLFRRETNFVRSTWRVWGYIVFGLDPVGVGVHFLVSVHYLLNQLMEFDQTCIYIVGRRGRVD